MKCVGILGGMGPEATILLMQKVMAAVPARDDADHVPLLVHQNPQVPSRIKALIEGGGEDPGPTLARMARDLAAGGAQALAMPCNTAHYYAPAVRAATALPFLDMLDLTATHLAGAGARRVGMLASPATRLADVFAAPFAARGLEPVFLEDDTALLAIIRAVKAGRDTTTLAAPLRAEAEALRAQGVDHLLVACTELSLMTGALPDDLPRTDSLDCLSGAIVAFARG
ncbi:MAG: amino acid racemase [Roseovarius sp.]|nr:amino acid racemase [Roseovarius sp.]